MHCRSKTFYRVNQLQTIICITFQVDMIKVEYFNDLMIMINLLAMKHRYGHNTDTDTSTPLIIWKIT